MYVRRMLLALMVGLGLALAGACGSAEVDDSKSLSELDEKEAESLCEELKGTSCTYGEGAAEITVSFETSCDTFAQGLQDAPDEGTCKTATAGTMRDCLTACKDNETACAEYSACAFNFTEE